MSIGGKPICVWPIFKYMYCKSNSTREVDHRTHPDVFAPGERPRVPDVHVWPLVGEGGGEDVARLDVYPDAVDHRPRDAVAVDGAELADAAPHQVQVNALLVKGLCRWQICCYYMM